MYKNITRYYTSILFLGLMPYSYTNAHAIGAAKGGYMTEHWLPKKGRVIVSGALVNTGIFSGDAMLPLLGNYDHFIFGDVLGGYGTNDTGLVSPGLGYRTIINNVIAGGYLFGDYDRTSLGANFRVISPGFEIIGLKWDAHLNGYMPTQWTKNIGTKKPASYYGLNYNDIFEYGTHNQYEQLVNQQAVIGKGLDGEVGYSFTLKNDLRSRVYLGGYYYQPPKDYQQVNNFGGVTAGFSQSLNKTVNVALFNSYDGLNHYNIGFSINLVFGGKVNTFSNHINDRLLDPVQRHIGIIATGAGTYDQKRFKPAGYSLVYDNVYFIAPNGLAPLNGGDGTYGNPLPLSQNSLDYIDTQSPSDARLYLQGGQGTTYTLNGGVAFTPLQPYSGQNFYGRTADYAMAAAGNQRPTIYLTTPALNNTIFAIHGNTTNNVFSDLQLTSDYIINNSNNAFIGDSSTLNLTFNDLNVTNFDGSAIVIHSATSNFAISNSTFINNQSTLDAQLSSGNIQISDSSISITSAYAAPGNLPQGISIQNVGNGTLSFIANNVDTAFDSNIASGSALFLTNTATGSVNASITNSTIIGNNLSGTSLLLVQNSGSGNINATMNQSIVNSLGGTASGNIEIASSGSGITTFNFISSTSSNGSYFGLGAFNNDGSGIININLQNSVLENSGTDLGLPFTYGNLALVSAGATVPQGTGTINLSAINSTLSNGPTYGLTVINNAPASHINVLSLSGTRFVNNTLGGITGYASAAGTTTINYTNAIFNNTAPNISYYDNTSQAINWIPSSP